MALLAGIAISGCKSDDPPAPNPGTGGSRASGGASGSGGTSATGGSTGSGGASSGGAPGSGGAAGGAGGAAGDAGSADAAMGDLIGMNSADAWVTYEAGIDGANPAAQITGYAKAWDMGGGKMKMTLWVMGLPPNTTFGSHLHKVACDPPAMAGGHYQHDAAPNADGGTDGGPMDPMYANATNEAWFDFQTDAQGVAMQTAMVDWIPAADKAKAIVVHAMKTGLGGVAGTKLACLPFAFQ